MSMLLIFAGCIFVLLVSEEITFRNVKKAVIKTCSEFPGLTLVHNDPRIMRFQLNQFFVLATAMKSYFTFSTLVLMLSVMLSIGFFVIKEYGFFVFCLFIAAGVRTKIKQIKIEALNLKREIDIVRENNEQLFTQPREQ